LAVSGRLRANLSAFFVLATTDSLRRTNVELEDQNLVPTAVRARSLHISKQSRFGKADGHAAGDDQVI
jgi:hypothetical protein